MANTTNFGWETPDDTDLVKDGAAAMRTLGNSIDASFVDLKGGTTGQVLAKASNTDLDFTWASDATGIQATIFDAKGDLIAASAADTATRLAVGSNNQQLLADSTTATGLKWAASATSTLTAKGDVLTATAANTLSRLAVGSNDQVLTADSSSATGLKWATPSSGGMTVIATGTLSGSSITISSIPGTYKNLQLVLEKCLPAASGEGPIIRFNGDTGTNYFRTTSTVINLQTWNETQLRLGGVQDNTASQSLTVCDILDYANTTTWKIARNICIQNRNGTPTSFDINNTQALFWYANNGASAITDIEIKTDTSAGFTSGTYILYGVK